MMYLLHAVCVCRQSVTSRSAVFFFQAEDGIRDGTVTGFRRVLFRSCSEHNRIRSGWAGKTRKATVSRARKSLRPKALSYNLFYETGNDIFQFAYESNLRRMSLT